MKIFIHPIGKAPEIDSTLSTQLGLNMIKAVTDYSGTRLVLNSGHSYVYGASSNILKRLGCYTPSGVTLPCIIEGGA